MMSESLKVTIVFEQGKDGWIVASIPERRDGGARVDAQEVVAAGVGHEHRVREREHAVGVRVERAPPSGFAEPS